MLWMLSALLLMLWLAGMVGAVGGWVHVFLVLAIVAVGLSLLRHDRYDTI